MEKNLEKNVQDTATEESEGKSGDDDKIETSQSHSVVNRIKNEELRTTKSSPHRSLELHHTRSFSEICHLHPSSTGLSLSTSCPKPKAIETLQRQVKRPESVLEISDLAAQDSEEEVEEDIIEAQEKGEEAMKIFLESNMSVPLDGAMSSSSCSLDTLDSDLASEHELIMGAWENQARDSVASSGSTIEKRFLTPSGQLLYREQQVDSMLDTKRLKLSPSSVERPMSPLAVRRTEDNVQRYDDKDNKINKLVSDSESEDVDEEKDSSTSSGAEQEYSVEKNVNDTKVHGMSKCECGLYSKVQDMQRLVDEYEVRYEELVNRGQQQCQEIKILRKDNVNMHKEHNRLQVVISESSKQKETLKATMTKMLATKDEEIDELNMNVKNLEDNIRKKNEEIAILRKTISKREIEISEYDESFKEISGESKALVEALDNQLHGGEGQAIDFEQQENKEEILSVLKNRRCSLREDFKKFSKQVNNSICSSEACSQATDASINELQNHLQENFQDMTAECKKTLSHVQQTEKGVENIQQKAAGLETMLETKLKEENKIEEKRFQRAHSNKVDLEWQLQELKGMKYEEVKREKSIINEKRIKWMNESERMTKEHQKTVQKQNKLKCENDACIKKLCQEKTEVNTKLQELKTDIKKRLENTHREKTALERQLNELKKKYNIDGETCEENEPFHSNIVTEDKKQETALDEQTIAWESKNKELIEKNKVLKKQLTEQEKLIECLVQEAQKLKKENDALNDQFLELTTSKNKDNTSQAVSSSHLSSGGMEKTKEYKELNDRLEQLTHLTNALSKKIQDNTSQHVELITSPKNATDTENRSNVKEILRNEQEDTKTMLAVSCRDQILWEIKGIYEEHFNTIQQYINKQQLENKHLKEQLVVQESQDEINKCYIASLKKANDISHEELQICKTKYQELKKEFHEIKDRLLITTAVQRISLYYEQEKNRKETTALSSRTENQEKKLGKEQHSVE